MIVEFEMESRDDIVEWMANKMNSPFHSCGRIMDMSSIHWCANGVHVKRGLVQYCRHSESTCEAFIEERIVRFHISF